MKKEDKDLLLKDLCGRLPYGVKGNFQNSDDELLRKVTIMYGNLESNGMVMTGDLKPYLFPLSNMTEGQRVEASLEFGLKKYKVNIFGDIESYSEIGEDVAYIDSESIVRYIDWLNAHHFDYRGLIEKGLAIDATGLGIYE